MAIQPPSDASTPGAANLTSSGKGAVPPGPPRKRAPDGSIVTSLLASGSVTATKISPDLRLGVRYVADLRTCSPYTSANWARTDGGEFELEFAEIGRTAYPATNGSATTHGFLGRQTANHALLSVLTTGAVSLSLNTDGVVVTTPAATVPIDGRYHRFVGGISGGIAYIKVDGVTVASAATAFEATTTSTAYYINYHGLSGWDFGSCVCDVTFRDLTSAANTYTWRMDESASPFANSATGSGTLAMAWTGHFPQCAMVDASGAGRLASVPQPAWRRTFNATTDWGSATGGYYTISIPLTTHGVTVPRRVSVWEGTTDLDLVFPDRVRITSAQAVEIRVAETPDDRFAGAIEVA